MPCLKISHARVIDPAAGRDSVGDILVADGRIVESFTPAQAQKAQLVDARGLIAAPGFVDLHAALCEPGASHKEDLRSGTRAAAAGGFTTVVCTANTSPAVDNVAVVQLLQDTIRAKACVNVLPMGCVTVGRKGEQMANIGSLHRAGVVAISDFPSCMQNNQVVRRAMEYAAMFKMPIFSHPQDTSLTQGAQMHEGEWSLRLGLAGWPGAAEDIMVSRDVHLAAYTGAHVHMQTLSSANAVDIVRRAKRRSVYVTAEVGAHHLWFTDACLRDYDARYKALPPFRTEKDRNALVDALLDGTVDCIVSAHSPHADYETDHEFNKVPFGISTLETVLPMALMALYHSARAPLIDVIDCLTRRPSTVLNLGKGTLAPGSDADIVLFDPNESWTPCARDFQSRGWNTPCSGMTLKGRVKQTFVRGVKVHG